MSKQGFSDRCILVNDAIQVLPPNVFQGGPWIHLATVVRGFKEYMAFRHSKNGHQVYIEEVDPTEPGLLKFISDENEFRDIEGFLHSCGILSVGGGKEFRLATKQ